MNKFNFLALSLVCATIAFGYNQAGAMDSNINIIKNYTEQNNNLKQMMDYMQSHTMEETADYFKIDIQELDIKLREYCIENNNGKPIKVNDILNYLHDDDNNHNTRKAIDDFGINKNIINDIWNKFGIINDNNEYILHKTIEQDILNNKIIIDRKPNGLIIKQGFVTKTVIAKSNLEVISQKYHIDIRKINKIFRNIHIKWSVG